MQLKEAWFVGLDEFVYRCVKSFTKVNIDNSRGTRFARSSLSSRVNFSSKCQPQIMCQRSYVFNGEDLVLVH